MGSDVNRVIAFGFLIERFDLFLVFAAPGIIKSKIAVARNQSGHVAGLVVIVLGIVMILVAAGRFARNTREIDDEKVFSGTGSRLDLALAALLVLLTAALLFYLSHALSAQA